MGLIGVSSKSLQRRLPCFPPESCVSGTQFSSWTCGCSLAFTLGIAVFDLHVFVHRLISARQVQGKNKTKSWFKTPLQTIVICSAIFCSYSQIFSILVINSNSSSFKRHSESPLLTHCISMVFWVFFLIFFFPNV